MKTIAITGGSGAIGKGIAKILITNGYKVILLARDIAKLMQVKNELMATTKSENIFIYSLDVTNEKQIITVLTEIWQHHRVEGLINAAGLGEPVDYFCSTNHDWQECIQTKLVGTINVIKEMGRQMKQHQCHGKIIIINGVFCYDPHPDFLIHSTVNSALAGFTKAASKYLAARGICLNTINPWITDSPSWENNVNNLAKLHHVDVYTLCSDLEKKNPLKRVTHVDDIGYMVAFLLSNQADYINGASINIDGGVSVGF